MQESLNILEFVTKIKLRKDRGFLGLEGRMRF
jgi:hypothetical protein